jgi:hypothetical protein
VVKIRAYIVYGTELKNLMERFIQQIKDRTECFDEIISYAIRKIATDNMSGTG